MLSGTDVLYQYKIVGDGNCLFRAIAELHPDFTQDEHAELRQRTYSYCLKNQHFMDITQRILVEIGSINHAVDGEVVIPAIVNILNTRIVLWYDTSSDRMYQVFTPKKGSFKHTIHLLLNLQTSHFDALTTQPIKENKIFSRWMLHKQKLVQLDAQLANKLGKSSNTKPQKVKFDKTDPKPKRRTRCIAFKNLPLVSRQKKILSWLVDSPVVCQLMEGGGLIEEEDIETMPDAIPNLILDDAVDLDDVRCFFVDDAGQLLNI